MKDGKVSGTVRLVEVIPITKSARGTLSYFSSEPLKIGQIAKVSLRKGEVPVVVVSMRSAKEAKAGLRSASYALKKISRRSVLNSFLPEHLLTLAEQLAEFYASSAGTVLANILPKFVIDNPKLAGPRIKIARREPSVTKEPLALQAEKEERFGQYRSVIRQNFARQSSVLFVSPSSEEAQHAFEELSKGISDFAFLFIPEKSKKEKESSWIKAREMRHPVLIVTTPFGLAFEKSDLGTYILERENSRSYRMFTRPFINIKVLLLMLARITKREIILGDSPLSIETLRHIKEVKYGELFPIKWRQEGAETELIDMKPEKAEERKRPFEVFSLELRALIKKALEERAGIFLYGARKGLSPTTVCGDCGAVLSCKECGAPVTLHKKLESNVYLCHRCGVSRSAETGCDVCGSWKLVPFGIGTELIAKEARRIFPLAQVRILDKEHARTKTQAKKIVEDFYERGGVLVGTELAFFHLDRTVYAGIVSLDALFSLPDFGAEERIFYYISRLREMCERKLIIQTRNIGKETLSLAAQGNIIDFYRREIEERNNFSYPPFSLFITVEARDIELMKNHFAEWNPEYLRNKMIIRMSKEGWPDEKLSRELALLPPNFLIKVDPESII